MRNQLDSKNESFHLAKKAQGLAEPEKRALIAIADTCSMQDRVCRKSISTLSREYGIKERLLQYGIQGRRKPDGTYYFDALIRRNIITKVSEGRKGGIPAVYSINLDVLRTYAQTYAQNAGDLRTNDAEPTRKSVETYALGAPKVLRRSEEGHQSGLPEGADDEF
jgi:hypothetical protein